MPSFASRLLGFLVAMIAPGLALGIDHWGSHLSRHTCDGHCRLRHSSTLAESTGIGSDYATAEGGLSNDGATQNFGTHLFLSVSSEDGVKRFASGLVRSGKVEYGPLTFEMNSTSIELPTEFRMLIDGEAAHPESFEVGNDWMGLGPDSAQGWTRTVQWNCPPLGRHSIQFEVRLRDQLVTSEPLWIEIVAPLKPEVVAVGSSEVGTAPIKSGKIVSVYQDTMVVRFSMPAAAEMIMHRPGLEDVKVQAIDECCFAFDLKDLSVGRHALKFSRVVGSGCSMTSEPSDTLWIQYEPTLALHSIRNENAIRRRAIVDEVRRISMSARPELHAPLIYNDVNAKFNPLNFQPQPHASSAPSSAPQGAAVNPAVGPTSAGEGGKGDPSTSPSDHAAGERVIDAKGIDGLKTPSPTPAPKLNMTTTSRSRFIALSGRESVRQEEVQAEHVHPDEPSTSLRKAAQDDADRLSKFEDDLALAESVWQANKVVSHVIFDAPAYFTQNGYGTSGEEDARNGLVLLEGMELSTYASGHWELKMPYIKSASPVVLHLQIQFKTSDGYWKPLTLQPVCFKAGRSCMDAGDCNCIHDGATGSPQNVRCECSEDGQPLVTLRGYSPILRREVGVFTDVRRRGSAVFGHGYSALVDRRSF